MSSEQTPAWCERLYQAKAAGLILYGRALGLSHGEAEDVLQETFLALLRLTVRPEEPERYCVRSFRNAALNYRRSLWRRLTRELESCRWFERAADESASERAAMRCLAELPPAQAMLWTTMESSPRVTTRVRESRSSSTEMRRQRDRGGSLKAMWPW